jgi:hypothetical protein
MMFWIHRGGGFYFFSNTTDIPLGKLIMRGGGTYYLDIGSTSQWRIIVEEYWG